MPVGKNNCFKITERASGQNDFKIEKIIELTFQIFARTRAAL